MAEDLTEASLEKIDRRARMASGTSRVSDPQPKPTLREWVRTVQERDAAANQKPRKVRNRKGGY